MEEQLRGWLAVFAKEAADRFNTYVRIHISVKDRKIAAIAITQNALLLTANRCDFEQIPGLRFFNWMD